jgi:hypothetical protein
MRRGGKKVVTDSFVSSYITLRPRGIPLLLPKDSQDASDSFLAREAKFARRWLYSKGIMAPEEELGLNDSTAVILSNLAMDEHRRVDFSEMQKLGLRGARS